MRLANTSNRDIADDESDENEENLCLHYRGVYIFLLIIDLLELSFGFILRAFSVHLIIRLYILLSRALVFALLLVIIIIWENTR